MKGSREHWNVDPAQDRVRLDRLRHFIELRRQLGEERFQELLLQDLWKTYGMLAVNHCVEKLNENCEGTRAEPLAPRRARGRGHHER